MSLAKDVYRETALLPKGELFGLQSQMRRAAVSVPSNIAEGHGRLSDKFLRVFLAQARGSLYELETQVQLCHDLGFFNKESADKLLSSCHEVAKMINGFLRAIKANEPTS
jgi:four helix bundle protein